jgi:hypothetical protein
MIGAVRDFRLHDGSRIREHLLALSDVETSFTSLYYFDVADDGDKPRLPDHMGTDHPGKECIPEEAADLLAGIARDHLPDGSHPSFSVSVRDSDSRVIYKATLSFAGGWQ